MIENRTEAKKILDRMLPSNVQFSNEQFESILDVLEYTITEYDNKTEAKIKGIEETWKHNYEITKKELEELKSGSTTIK